VKASYAYVYSTVSRDEAPHTIHLIPHGGDWLHTPSNYRSFFPLNGRLGGFQSRFGRGGAENTSNMDLEFVINCAGLVSVAYSKTL
jgi:hypothetical protein